MTYYLDYGYSNKLTIPKNFTNFICLSPIKNNIDINFKYLWVRLENSWENEKLTSQQWLDLVLPPLRKYFVKVKLTKEYSQVWFDTGKYNWSQIGTIVTLLRYLGGHKDYIENYLKILESYPKIGHWHAVYCAHKLPGSNWNHAIIKPGILNNSPIDDFTIEKVVENLNNTLQNEMGIHKSWMSGNFGTVITIEDIPKMFKNPYFLEKKAA